MTEWEVRPFEHMGVRCRWRYVPEHGYEGEIIGANPPLTFQAFRYYDFYDLFERTAEVLASQRECPDCGV